MTVSVDGDPGWCLWLCLVFVAVAVAVAVAGGCGWWLWLWLVAATAEHPVEIWQAVFSKRQPPMERINATFENLR